MKIINANSKIKQLEEEIKISKEVNSKLQDKLDYDEALKRHAGSNTGIPTSKTPINKKKVIPNGRVKTGRRTNWSSKSKSKDLKENRSNFVSLTR